MRKIEMLLSLFLVCNLTFAQQISMKDQAIEQFKKENYSQAISLMEKALIDNPKDAEIYYYLGFFNHYNAYDSRPLQGYDSSYSQKILKYLDKALEINPNYGDAKYFYLTECSAAAFKEYQNNNLLKVKQYFEKAYQKGAIPDWAIELGKNMLSSCDNNAILFTHGDFSLNICLFAQLHYDFRKDITVVPLALLDRPSFVLALSDNVSSKVIHGLNTGLSKEQILDIHPYKWDTLTVKLQINSALKKEYSLPNDYSMEWVIEPDLISNRMVAKIEGENSRPRAYISPTRAMLLNIIETNNWDRPIYFTNTFETYFLAGLDKYFQNCGLVSKLTPIKTNKTKWEINLSVLENLVFNTSLDKLKTIIDNDQPRASGITGLYSSSYYWLADYYSSVGRKNDIVKVIDQYKQKIMIGFNPDSEKGYLKEIEKMKN
jgi:tetratricopeptide (TPR) repeat protein